MTDRTLAKPSGAIAVATTARWVEGLGGVERARNYAVEIRRSGFLLLKAVDKLEKLEGGTRHIFQPSGPEDS